MKARTAALMLIALASLGAACPRVLRVPLLNELENARDGVIRKQWPAPPAEARVHYLGMITDARQLRGASSVWSRIGDALFGRSPIHFVRPAALCVRGRMLAVADPGAAVVHVLDLYERRWHVIAETLKGPLQSPVGVACLPEGRLVVSDSIREELWLFNGDGRALGRLVSARLRRPTGVTFDAVHERVWVVETLGHAVRAFDLDGKQLLQVGARGVRVGQFNYPTMLAADPEGGVWLTDSLNFRVQHLDARGRPRGGFGTAGDRPGSFARPRGLAVDAAGRIFVVDALFDAVQIFDRDGRLLLAFGSRGEKAGRFWLPSDVALDDRGHLFVADSYNKRVQVFAYRPPGHS